MASEKDVLLAHAMVGEKCREFLQTDVGRLIEGRARGEAEEAMEALKDADPEDSKLIRKLQNDIYRAESIIDWLNQTIEAGEQAFAILDQPEE